MCVKVRVTIYFKILKILEQLCGHGSTGLILTSLATQSEQRPAVSDLSLKVSFQ